LPRGTKKLARFLHSSSQENKSSAAPLVNFETKPPALFREAVVASCGWFSVPSPLARGTPRFFCGRESLWLANPAKHAVPGAKASTF
jgi:hypothetical protein